MYSKNWDIIVAGGGLSGVTAAVAAARKGCRVLIIEKMSFLGGCATASLVTPMMKNSDSDGNQLNKGLYEEILYRMAITGNSATHSNGNPGWFNPEEMKFVLDEFCEENNVDLLFDTRIMGVNRVKDNIKSIICLNKAGKQEYSAEFFVDATGDADLAFYAGVTYEAEEHQSFTLRFNMENVNICKFSQWLTDIEPEMVFSSVEYKNAETILITTAHTSEDLGWKLRPYFKLAIKDGVLKPEDAEYFQIFTIPGQRNAMAFNCPRIYSEKPLNPLDPWDITYAYIRGRKQIKRLEAFCKTYLTGFEDAYISQVAPSLGIRESRRIEGEYKLTEDDILKGKKFKISAAKSNYPIDIHGNTREENQLKMISEDDYYDIPAETMVPKDISNLLVAGKALSATFKAQASARIQPNCIAMGEFAGNYWADRIIASKEKK